MVDQNPSEDGASSRRNVLRSVGAATAAGAVASGQAAAATDEARAQRAKLRDADRIERHLRREAGGLLDQLAREGVDTDALLNMEVTDVESFDPDAVEDDFARVTNWKRDGELSARVELRRVTDERTVTLIAEPEFGVYSALLDDGDTHRLIDADGTREDRDPSAADIACIDDLFEGCVQHTVYCYPDTCYAYPDNFSCSFCPYFDCQDYCNGY